MFQEGQQATAPWRETGEQALGALSDIYGLGGYATQGNPQDIVRNQNETARFEELQQLTSGGEPRRQISGGFLGEQVNPEYETYLANMEEMQGLEKSIATYGEGQAAAPGGPAPDPYDAFFSMQDKLREGFKTSPGQEFQLAEANKAAKRSLSAQGFSDSGAEMKELQRLAQGQASNEWSSYLNNFGDYTNSLRSMAGQGQTSAGQTATMSANVGTNLSNTFQTQGAQAAQSQINQGNIVSDTIATGAQLYGMYQGQNSMPPPGGDNYGLPSSSTAYDPYGINPGASRVMIA